MSEETEQKFADILIEMVKATANPNVKGVFLAFQTADDNVHAAIYAPETMKFLCGEAARLAVDAADHREITIH